MMREEELQMAVKAGTPEQYDLLDIEVRAILIPFTNA
jgi:hypothetical protein